MNSSFPNKKEHFVKKRSSFMTNKEESNVCRSSTFQVNRTKNATGKRRLTSSNRATCQHFIGRTTQQTFLVINLAS